MAMDDHHCFSDFFEEHDPYTYSDTNNLSGGSDDLFSILESLDGVMDMELHDPPPVGSSTPLDHEAAFVFSSSSKHQLGGEDLETELETSPKTKRLKLSGTSTTTKTTTTTTTATCSEDGQQRMSHITVERNRRKQMNEHLTVLRSLMPCFYVKRGDQASIIGGVVDYINELQQVLQSLEAKKQRKVYSEVLSPRVQQAVSSSTSSPRLPSSPLVLSPRKPPLSPLSPRPLSCTSLPISPRTPQPGSPYKPAPSVRLQQPPPYLSSPTNTILSTTSLEPSPASSIDLSANSKSTLADVEVKFSGPNVLLKTVSPPIPGQALRIISALEDLELEILHVSITTMDDTMRNSFTIKIGIECKLSAEELAHQIQQTFC